MENQTRAEAERLVAEMLARQSDSPLQAHEGEPELERFLDLVSSSPGDREMFVEIFGDMISARRQSPEWLVAYCMHELRWAEVHSRAETELRLGQPATLSIAAEVLDAYEEEWVGRKLFARFGSKR